jgi:hypothetical protein
MSTNVKPGDFARVVNSKNGNNGKMCFVEDLPGHEDTVEGELCWFWMVTLLNPCNVRQPSNEFRQESFGGRVWGNDRKLRRVDPPADDTEVAETKELGAP